MHIAWRKCISDAVNVILMYVFIPRKNKIIPAVLLILKTLKRINKYTYINAVSF